jgi:NitT/TauT family transport system substrate-binding protein
METNKRLILLILAALLLTALGLWSCSKEEYSRKLEAITIGAPPLEQHALIFSAIEQGIFAKNGVNIVIKDYSAGIYAIVGMLKDEVDIAEATEFALIQEAFQAKQIKVVACTDKFDIAYVVGRKDRGINVIKDLKGKKVGVPRNTIGDFYLGRFLELHGMRMRDVTLVDVRPPQFVDAITGGDIDAIVAWEPYIYQMRKKVDGVFWPAQSGQPAFNLLIGKNEWIIRHNNVIKRFLKSLSEAEAFLVNNPDKTRGIVQTQLNLDGKYLDSVWNQHQFGLSLDQSLIAAMEDQARWMIKNNLTNEKTVPDLLEYIYIDGLKAVKPEAVNIIR